MERKGVETDLGTAHRDILKRNEDRATLAALKRDLATLDRQDAFENLKRELSEAEKVLAQGQQRTDICWDRNTAFAQKCIGRMDRIEAELTDSAEERAKLLADSALRLRSAIELFSGSAEFGPNHRQVGDCYSLLGRSHLVAKDFSAAMDDLRKAYDILQEGSSKEYMDLLILSGDLEIARGNREDGERYYDQVIDSPGTHGREASEIRARAFMQRGRSRQRRNSRDAAKQDLERAASMWKALDEHALAAEAEWALMKMNPSVDEKTISMFDEPKSRLVAVTALQQYLDRLGTTKVHARRAQPTRSQVDQMVKEARRRVAEAHREW